MARTTVAHSHEAEVSMMLMQCKELQMFVF